MTAPVLLLLHGMGANGGVWHDVADLARAAGWEKVLAPDLAGHGSAPRQDGYTFASKARALADHLDPDRHYVVLGHSLGGVIAVELADPAYGLRIDEVVALGVKSGWTQEELDVARRLAGKPQAMFETRDAAIERYLKVAGLYGLVDHSHPSIERGVARADDGQWRTTVDPRTIDPGRPDMVALIRASAAPVRLARGGQDPLCTEEMLTALDEELGLTRHTTLPGRGHNPHVEAPHEVLALLPAPAS